MEQSRSPPFSPPFDHPLNLARDPSASASSSANVNAPVSPSSSSSSPCTSQTQQPQDVGVAVAQDALGTLPTITRTRDHQVFLVEDDVDEFLKRDLDLSRLDKIHGYLWMAGRPLNARSLQRQRMMGFDIVLTDRMDLHLLKFSNRLLVKPLPEYILNFDFWDRYLCGCRERHEAACGLLLSFVWLICSPLDLKIAHQHDLLPARVEWAWWKSFVTSFVAHIDVNSLDQVHRRFHFGELRLGRINSIYRLRFCYTHFIRGYLYGYNRYVVFFERNFAWLLGVFVYFSLVLSAMQVGSSVPPLSGSRTFQRATYGFVVFSIVLVVFFLGLLAVLFASIFFYNMVAAISHSRRERLNRDRLARNRRERKEQ